MSKPPLAQKKVTGCTEINLLFFSARRIQPTHMSKRNRKILNPYPLLDFAMPDLNLVSATVTANEGVLAHLVFTSDTPTQTIQASPLRESDARPSQDGRFSFTEAGSLVEGS
jgi:hypothetical protein